MRRLVVFTTLLALALPSAASAAVRAPGDGTLSVRDLDGSISVHVRGGVIGRCSSCVLLLDEWKTDELVPVVTGAGVNRTDLDDDGSKERFAGKDLRWKVMGKSFSMIVRKGVDVDLSLVGKGRIDWIRGTDGSFVLNGGELQFVDLVSPPFFQLNPVATNP
ncbi:MAG: hypothetical protein QOI67_1627 [Gaiellaceae bacterium]|jgi:hypothetical protein|nr:hypothetical protein [Gaiellaceae bacterium]